MIDSIVSLYSLAILSRQVNLAIVFGISSITILRSLVCLSILLILLVNLSSLASLVWISNLIVPGSLVFLVILVILVSLVSLTNLIIPISLVILVNPAGLVLQERPVRMGELLSLGGLSN